MTCRVAALFAALLLSACAGHNQALEAPTYTRETPVREALQSLPPPSGPVHIAVYEFQDETGQHKPSDRFAEYSRAVTQGAYAYAVQALKDAGGGHWFRVLERKSLDNLLQERKIIDTTRALHRGPQGEQLPPIDPLRYAAVIMEGSIIAYESNTHTGGVGARFLGVGGDTEWRRDMVTVGVRLVSVRSSEILATVTASKSIFSVAIQGGVFKFISPDELLEIEAGVTSNEPTQLAVRQAVEKAIYGLVVKGAASQAWSFAEPAVASPLIDRYFSESGDVTPANFTPAIAGPRSPGGLRPAPVPAVPEGINGSGLRPTGTTTPDLPDEEFFRARQ